MGIQALFISDIKYYHHIALNTWNGVGAPKPSPHSAGLESFTLMLPNEEKKHKMIAQLENIGATVMEESGSVVAIDSSGNRIQLRV